jgi:hypothetical protein
MTVVTHAPPGPSALRALALYGALAIVPPLVFSVLPVTSQALGIAIAVVVATVLLMLGPRQNWTLQQLKLPVVVLLGLLLHGILIAQWRPLDVGRFGGSLLLLGAVLLLASRVAQPLFAGMTRAGLQGVFIAFVICGALSAAGLRVATVNATSKPVFPFSEASHFGLALCPLILSLAVMARRPVLRLLYIGAGLALALSLQNFTLLVGLMLISAVCLPWRWLLPVGAVAVAGIGLALSAGAEGLAYYTERLDFSGDSENLTALVVIQGWQMIADAWAATSGWGLGLQQLGVQGPTADVSDLIFTLNGGDYLNLLDGGFLLAKLAGELGAFGAALAVAFAMTGLRCAFVLRRVATGRLPAMPAGAVFARAVVVMYLLEVFIRSAGYLTGAAALTLAALLYLWAARARVPVRGLGSASTAVPASR